MVLEMEKTFPGAFFTDQNTNGAMDIFTYSKMFHKGSSSSIDNNNRERILMKSSIFWDTTRSPVKVNQSFGGSCRLLLHASVLSYSVTLKMNVTCSSKMSVDFQRTTWRHIPEDRTLLNYRRESLKYCILMKFPFHNYD
jgi:hypothetical protein